MDILRSQRLQWRRDAARRHDRRSCQRPRGLAVSRQDWRGHPLDRRPIWRHAHLPNLAQLQQQQDTWQDCQRVLAQVLGRARIRELALHAHARLLHLDARLRHEVVLCRAGRYRVRLLELLLHHHGSRPHMETAHPVLHPAHNSRRGDVLPRQVAGRSRRDGTLRRPAAHEQSRADDLLLGLHHDSARDRLPVQSHQGQENTCT